MGTRALAIALAALALAPPALAQAVPPPEHSRVETPAEAISSHGSRVEKGSQVVEAGADTVGAVLEVKKDLDAATKLEGTSEAVKNAIRTTEKVGATAGLVGHVAGGAAVLADTVIAYDKCTDPKYSKLECAYASTNAVAGAASFIPGAPAALSTTWALSTAGGEYINSLAPDASVKLYDWMFANENVIKDATESQLAELRQRRRDAYDRYAQTLQSKQADYDAQQAQLAAEQQAAAQNQVRASGDPGFVDTFLAALQRGGGAQAASSGGGYALPQGNVCVIWMACANNGKTWPGYEKYDSTAANYSAPSAWRGSVDGARAPAPRPPPVDTACHPAPGKVCTGN